MATLRWGSATHEGQHRAQNEDHAHAGPNLFVVADGMGGHLAGEVASEMAVDRLEARLPDGAANSLDDLVEAIIDANNEIYHGSAENADQAGMGTTITAIAIVTDPHDGEVLGIANVGDSRGYVLRHGRLRQVTIDHSFVQELVAEGAITSDEARFHPRRNIVTRALGIEPYVRVDSWTMPIIRGDRFVLCSDGLVDEITDDEITAVLNEHLDDPDAAAQGLVDAANAAGGRDNITVVVLDVLEGDEPPDPTEELDILPAWNTDDDEPTGETQIISDPPHDDIDPEGLAALAVAGADVPEIDDPEINADGLIGGATSCWPDPSTLPPTLPGGADNTKPARADLTATPTPPATKSRGGRVMRFILALGVAAVLILGFAIFATWARSGYYVAFDDDGQVVIYQGRKDGVLWFEPTVEATGFYSRDELDADSIALVEQRIEFESQASAQTFVAGRLQPADPTDETGSTGSTDNPITSTPITTTDPGSTTPITEPNSG